MELGMVTQCAIVLLVLLLCFVSLLNKKLAGGLELRRPVALVAVLPSYNTVVLYSRDPYEIIGLHKSLHSIKQPCSSIYLKKTFAMHRSC